MYYFSNVYPNYLKLNPHRKYLFSHYYVTLLLIMDNMDDPVTANNERAIDLQAQA